MYGNPSKGTFTLYGLVDNRPPRPGLLSYRDNTITRREYLDDGGTWTVGEEFYRQYKWEDCSGRRDIWRHEERLITIRYVDDEHVIFDAPCSFGRLTATSPGSYFRWIRATNVLECNVYGSMHSWGTAFFSKTKPTCVEVAEDVSTYIPVKQ